jgi:lysophospholipase L1-like esterase
MRTLFSLALAIIIWSHPGLGRAESPAQSSPSQSELRLTLPPVIYAVAGDETAIYFDNVVLTEHPEDYQFAVQCDLGKTEPRRWTAVPTVDQVGDHPLKLTVQRDGKKLAEGSLTLKVLPPDAGAGQLLTLLIVGDSLTHATQYPNEIARLLSRPGNPKWSMLGTHRPANAAEGVMHEGYGGWTWERFVKLYSAEPSPDKRQNRSPFVFAENGQPALDVTRYLKETADGRKPDCITFLLGINDCFSVNPDDPHAIDERIDNVFKQAEILLTAFRQAAPDADLGVCLTTPPNARESGFEANYKGRYHRWGWKRIQHQLVERQLEHFGGREKDRIYIVPTEVNLDPLEGYPVDNGVHPNAVGYKQIGSTIYAWLKWRAAERATP